MAGIAGQIAATGATAFASSMLVDAAAHWLILAGFLINAGAPPLSAWLPDAYPEASWSRHGVPVGLHDQDRGLRAAARLPRRRAADLGRPVHGVLRHRLRASSKTTCAASSPTRSSTRSASWSRASASAREMALNGAAAHAFTHIIYKALLLMSAGSVLLHDRQAQMHRPRRPVPHHAADDALRHHRRAVDLGIPAHLRLHLQVDDRRGRRPSSICRSSGSCSPPRRPASS